MYKATSEFWECYSNLPPSVQQVADKNFELLKRDPKHPSLNLKKVGIYWVARVGINYWTLAFEEKEGLSWFWIGKHDEYMRRIRFGF
ncbi:hypothetical protein F4009_04925 [Candidatus Poribacteria bacterium]|nr:hypothetical protein [Candidatus Poribacteria bacterium]MYK93333.1 hypothetical protein [Candidatus Poribacteria bacterium]